MTGHIDVLKSIISAWKEKDIEGVLGHMDEAIVWHFAAAAAPPLLGKPAARRFLERFGADMGEVRWRIFDYAEVGDRLFVEGVDEYFTRDGIKVAAPYAGVLDFRGLLVVGWRDYVDVGVVAEQKAGKDISDQVKRLIDRPAIF